MPRAGLLALAAVAALSSAVFASPAARADGLYFPERAVEATPRIPVQRALLIHDGAEERLIVSSAIEGDGARFGWILPVPSRPRDIAPVSPGVLTTLAHLASRTIVHDRREDLWPPVSLFVVVAIWTVLVLIVRPPTRLRLYMLFLGVLVLSAFFGVTFMTRLSGPAGLAGGDGVVVESFDAIGSYDVAVLTASSAGDLDGWLEGNGFRALGKIAEPVVDDYIKKRWSFVAARLSLNAGGGASMPHPLSIRFSCPEPIYPMRLTGAGGGRVGLDLFVAMRDGCAAIRSPRAAYDRLETEACDVLAPAPQPKTKDRLGELLQGQVLPPIQHPGVVSLLEPGTVLTALSGVLSPEEMREDLVLERIPAKPYRQIVYSGRGATETGTMWAALVACVLLWLRVSGEHRTLQEKGGRVRFLRRAVAPALIIGGMVGLLRYHSLPRADVEVVVARRHLDRNLETAARALASAAPRSADEAKKILAEKLGATDARNPFMGGPVRHEDSPGNYTIEQRGQSIVLTTFGAYGEPAETVIAAGTSTRASP